jgi:hypothetical protein
VLRVVGKTEEGQLIVAGVYRYYETTGLPLDVMFDCLRQKGAIPDWLTFYVEAVRAGMKHERILAKLDPALVDAYGFAFRDVVIERLELVTRHWTE